MDKNEPQTGNIGVITTKGKDLYEVTGQQNGLLYCLPLNPPKITAVCLPWQFWVLLDKMPD